MNVGSFAGQFPTPLLSTYSGTKSFLIAFSQALGEELRRSKIDVQCLNTYFVVSNMSKIRKSSSIIPTPRQYVQKVLSKIGRSGGAVSRPYTMTIWPMHAIIDWALQAFVGNQKWSFRYNYGENNRVRLCFARSLSLLLLMTLDMSLATRKRALKKAERLAKAQ